MLSADFRAAKALMDMRLDETQNQAEARDLRRLAGPAQDGRLLQQRCWLLCQVGQLLKAMGQRLVRLGLPESVRLES